MCTQVMRQIMLRRIGEYQANKPLLKQLDDAYASMVKNEKNKLKQMRGELAEKKRKISTKKTSKSSSQSPGKENKASKSNSFENEIEIEIKKPTSRQQVLLKQQEEKDQIMKI